MSIGVKKRLNEVQAENEAMAGKLPFKEHQKLFNRLLTDIRNVSEWHDLSIEMLIGEQFGSQDNNNNGDHECPSSPPPEEIRLRMPDMSALNIQSSSLHNSLLNDSSNFNLDEFLVGKNKDKDPQVFSPIIPQLNHGSSLSNNNYNTANFNATSYNTSAANNFQANNRNYTSSTSPISRDSKLNQLISQSRANLLSKQDAEAAGHQRHNSRGQIISPITQTSSPHGMPIKGFVSNQAKALPDTINEFTKILDELPQIDENDISGLAKGVLELIDRAENVIAKNKLATSLKDLVKNLEDRKLRILALSLLKRREDRKDERRHF